MGKHIHKLSAAGLLVTLGIIFGDIGTSPLYVLNAIVGSDPINSRDIVGAISAIFWTLTLQTTVKYVIITLRADNKGEGGIFSLYTLIRKTKVKWLLFPAIIGGSTLLADGIITPPISVSSAIEGLRVINPDIPTIPIVIAIITILFGLQQFGTKLIGKFFGPIMFTWFSMLGILGGIQLSTNINVLSAFNPYHAYELLMNHKQGFLILGAVFLCTTGAEALYSDLGHCGKENIRVSWIFVKSMLLLNYFGQGAWLISHEGKTLKEAGVTNPFYAIMPDWFLPFGIGIATLAAVVASQAMISGSFTLINEAIRLNFWPKVKIKYPTELKGQLYIPSLNWMLWIGCVLVVLYFKESSGMEAAYGLAIVMTMLMTTSLLNYYLILKRYNKIFIAVLITTYAVIEISFLIANLHKFSDGGYITLLIAMMLMATMFVWYFARKIRNRYLVFVKLSDYLPVLEDLSKDLSVPKYATNLVYLTSADHRTEIESKIMYSILNKQPKRADIYWFVHVHVVDEPYTMEYRVNEFIHDDVIRIDFRLGFRVAPRISLMFKKVVEDMVKNKEVDVTSRYASLNKNNIIGDFRFILIEKFISYDNDLPFYEKWILDCYNILKKMGLSEEKAFGLDSSSVTIESFPLLITAPREICLTRVD
ncbi:MULTISPECIES: KUP/HAK/KT family potassium transporter [Flavobacterium]|uniref:KUP/HAK/KT family potassium transporter n=1 Tax=Flavobacterium TaxID=237 RepID=UPI0006FAD062|nr:MULTISPECIES: KUP/HAK/KT family potassium transporter [Flavobacterium]THD30205.1 MAG: potassium transporter Kup [Flavobacterium johnsoniae]KQS45712.1 potassium transporter Kup [Flavobacterium sp. Leaf359]MBL7868669.1 KUP/HAK/KT family potassium transporter [Flavobacterium lindanitolerans]MDQ7961106.1 KUP/HAK/KT family potassium transporter [Flavobacterium lindanitolerans]OJX53432.1 MAG: potassium transporter Kup [Flavobacterium sp. 38-13]